ncbi:lysozyme inhibitor LprI family protein [Roseibium sp.]|uniref:lysozyme inhibitor LprI family protein n=1 Tax=Roseibium sp. TaxID=1936156 RepID=UPI003A978D00
MATFRRTLCGIGAFLFLSDPGLALDQNAPDAIDCGYPLNQMEMTFCAQQAWQDADAELNAAYRTAMDRMREMDGYLDTSLKGAEEALRDAQRAWIPYRDKACEAYGFLARGGSMEPMLVFGCLATVTKKRTEELNELAEGLGN